MLMEHINLEEKLKKNIFGLCGPQSLMGDFVGHKIRWGTLWPTKPDGGLCGPQSPIFFGNEIFFQVATSNLNK